VNTHRVPLGNPSTPDSRKSRLQRLLRGPVSFENVFDKRYILAGFENDPEFGIGCREDVVNAILGTVYYLDILHL
jgi:hypothetical protein